ncbi:inositol polyphosphate kinase family protein, partial [Clostridium perfringens]
VVVYDKNFGKGLTKQNVSRALMVIFDTLPSRSIRRKVLNNFLMRLQLIYNCLLDAEVRIISGSLLFIVEGDHERWKPVLENEDLYESMDPLIR